MLSDRSSSRKPQFKSCCIHWIKLTTIPYPTVKDNFFWLSLEIGQTIKQNIKKEQISSQIRKYPTIFLPKQCNLFINRLTLVIYCITCQKEIFDIYPTYSSHQDLFFIKHEKLNPFKIRSHFLKPINQENMFLSNLQNPKSFQKQKSNCAIFISPCRNSFLECVIRLLAFNPTFSFMTQKIDQQKVKSFSFRQLIKIIKILRSGKFRILNINEFQDVFFSQFPEYLSYENHDPIKVLFLIFKLIENQFGWKDLFCHPKQILESPKIQWDFSKNQHKYSPLKQMLLSKTQTVQVCDKCNEQKQSPMYVNYFECLSLEVKSQGNNLSFLKKKTTELNILKAIQNSFKNDKKINYQEFQRCKQCSQNTHYQIKTIIEPGNYLLFNIQQSQKLLTTVPKDFDLRNLCHDKFIVNEEGTNFEFIAGIYKQNVQKSLYGDQYGIFVYHIQNNKYLCFSQRKITQHQSLNMEKSFLILLYKRRSNENLFPIIKNIKSTLYLIEQEELEVDIPVPLPDFYDVYLTQNYKVPPLINPFICHHGLRNVDIEKMTKCNKIKYLPVEIYNFLVDQFGGRKIQFNGNENFREQCQECIKGLEKFHQIKLIQREAMKYADNFSIKKGEVLIYKPWIEEWKSYLYERSRDNYNLWGNAPPREINNFLGMKDNNIKQIDHSKYSKISNEVWMTLLAFHSGGPQLTTKKIAKNNSVRNYVNLKMDEATVLYEQLIRILSQPAKIFFKKKFNSRSILLSPEKEQHQSQIVSQGSSDEENDKISIGSTSKSRQKSRSKFIQSSRNIPFEK